MKPLWTDIVVAIAAIIAVPGAIAGFIALFFRDKQKQEQINELSKQTQEFAEQTNELRIHSYEMEKSNRLLERQFNLFREFLGRSIDLQEQERRREELIRREEIQPFLRRDRGGIEINKVAKFPIRNFGGTALEFVVENLSSESSIVSHNATSRIEHDQIINLKIQNIQNRHQSASYNIRFTFTDLDNNPYEQNLRGTGLNYNITDPIEVE